MGAWGFGPLENDGASDLIAEIEDGDFSFEGVEWAFEDEDYLEVDGGQMAIAMAALVQVGRGERPLPHELSPTGLEAFMSQIGPEQLEFIQEQVKRALSSPDESELYELWLETDEFDQWYEASNISVRP